MKATIQYDEPNNKWVGIEIPATNLEYLAIAKGTVKAGIDVNNITEFNDENGKITVKLPQAEILSCKIEDDTWEVWRFDVGVLRRITSFSEMPDFIHNRDKQAEEDLIKQAEQYGILAQADERARIVLERLIKSAGAKEVVFK